MNNLAGSPALPPVRADRSGRPLISVVLSFRNESGNIGALVDRLDAMFSRENVQYELVFVNDASTDDSLQILLERRASNPRIKILDMSRRFGVAECVLAGLSASSGDAVVYMDADLQDPPEIVPALLARWRSGADVVHTVRTRRKGENAMKMFATRLAYRIIHVGSTLQLPVDAGDFKLLTRSAVDHLLRLRESDPYLRGLVVWIGFNQAFVEYERDARHAGRTHFPFFSRNPWKTFVLGVTSFSFLPIYACAVLAALGSALAVALFIGGLVIAVRDLTVTGTGGWLLLGAAASLAWAVTLAAIGGVGLYVIRIYKDVRGRPPYIVQSAIGFAAPATAARTLDVTTEQVER
jgi:glycosyltransferase involved in cell wall biosynthesis